MNIQQNILTIDIKTIVYLKLFFLPGTFEFEINGAKQNCAKQNGAKHKHKSYRPFTFKMDTFK